MMENTVTAVLRARPGYAAVKASFEKLRAPCHGCINVSINVAEI
jgi:hypothetical protein